MRECEVHQPGSFCGDGMKLTAKQIRKAASDRLMFEYGVAVTSHDTFYTIAEKISAVTKARSSKKIQQICKHIIKKFAVEYIESRKPVPMDQVKRDWYKSSYFLKSDEWYTLRYKVLLKNGGRCQCCGRGRKEGAIIQIDHIKPRSIYPELAISESNLQILCRECNMGKSNKSFKDWR
jgi:hypothetical protein